MALKGVSYRGLLELHKSLVETGHITRTSKLTMDTASVTARIIAAIEPKGPNSVFKPPPDGGPSYRARSSKYRAKIKTSPLPKASTTPSPSTKLIASWLPSSPDGIQSSLIAFAKANPKLEDISYTVVVTGYTSTLFMNPNTLNLVRYFPSIECIFPESPEIQKNQGINPPVQKLYMANNVPQIYSELPMAVKKMGGIVFANTSMPRNDLNFVKAIGSMNYCRNSSIENVYKVEWYTINVGTVLGTPKFTTVNVIYVRTSSL